MAESSSEDRTDPDPRPDLLSKALAAELRRLKADLETEEPGHAHAQHMQLAMFRMRLSAEAPFYQEVWRRIERDAALWAQIERLVQDIYEDWVRTNRSATPDLLPPRRRSDMEQGDYRTRKKYIPHYYAGVEVHPSDGRRKVHRTIFDPTAPVETPNLEGRIMPRPDPQQLDALWKLIHLCKESYIVSRRVASFWAKAAGRPVVPDLDLVPDDEREDAFALSVFEILISRTVPERWFLAQPQKTRDSLLAKPYRLRIPLDDYSSLKAAHGLHPKPDVELATVIDEAARALIDLGHPQHAWNLLDAYVPHLEKNGEIKPYVYHDQFLALTDLGRPRLARRAARRFLQEAEQQSDDDAHFVALICVQNSPPASRRDNRSHPFPDLHQAADSAPPGWSKVWRFVQLSVVCDQHRLKLAAEDALLAATDAAGSDMDLLGYVIDHQRMRDALSGNAHPGAPRAQGTALLGTSGIQAARFADLVESYYTYYPEERPNHP